MQAPPLTGVWHRGRRSTRVRVDRWRSKWWHIGQCAVAAGAAWLVAAELLGHPSPFLAPAAAVIGLGTSYGQRLRRVAEITIGVSVGVLLADLLVAAVGSGFWQIIVVVALAMSVAFLLDGGQILVTQAAVQATVISILVPDTTGALTRWTDGLVGGGVALVAATVVPAAPLRRPRERAAVVLRKVAELLRAAGEAMVDGEADRSREILADARATDRLIRELQDAAAEGLSVVSSSPFRIRHRDRLRQLADLVEPLDRALRTTRVLVRQTAVATYRGQPVPEAYAGLAMELAAAADIAAAELEADRMAAAARPALLAVGEATARVPRSDELSAEVVLAQLRSLVVDLLLLTGMSTLESTDALPPPPR